MDRPLLAFEGKAGLVFLSYDQAALDQRKYFMAHGGPHIKALDPSLFQLMAGSRHWSSLTGTCCPRCVKNKSKGC